MTRSRRFIENDVVIGDVDEHFAGNYLNEEVLLQRARAKGYSTAAIGKVGPTLLFDHTDRADGPGLHTIVLDDATGGAKGVPLSDEMKAALTNAGLPPATPGRGENSKAGDFRRLRAPPHPTLRSRPIWAEVATEVVLPMFKERNKPFVLVFWSRDPDGKPAQQWRQP